MAFAKETDSNIMVSQLEEFKHYLSTPLIGGIMTVSAFCNFLISEEKKVRLYTINGVQMMGSIVKTGENALLFRKENDKLCMIYHHAISTIEVDERK